MSLAAVHAPHRVLSSDLEARLAATYARVAWTPGSLAALTGVVERRFWDEGTKPSAVASRAADHALERAGVARSRVGAIVNTSVCKDYLEPSVAALVHGNLRLSTHCLNFDVGNACLAFLTGMQLVAVLIERGTVDYGLVVDGETSREVVLATLARLAEPACDAQMLGANLATLTLGSGAAAMLLARADLAPNGHRVLSVVSRAATEHRHLCVGQADGMVTDAGALLVAGIDLAKATFAEAETLFGWDESAFDEFVLHQVSAVHTSKLVERLGIDGQKVLPIYPDLGNVGPASIPLALDRAAEAGRIKKGSRVGLLGIGSGLNCSMMELVW